MKNKLLLSFVTLSIVLLSGCGVPSNSNSQTASNKTPSTTAADSSIAHQTKATMSQTTSETVKKISFVLQPGEGCCAPISQEQFKEFIAKLPGITKTVAGPNERMTVWYNSAKTSPSEIGRQIMMATGYLAKL
ncbi:hypothetical protein PP175_16360 [Aneurinibacillus sp. Ricciae_BoGa-3]|uniref:hypothetical protein n=1 Tax=Aneurinibacillus sp. Ricciae_BoGa-3 TaxID=3022697 RepID=UPI002341CE5C|nr:hypothetical protein [Aneurinibacillus sp. Ricciae_BoGa-3]WCK52985.1 hypothetical protein PP175_16360 [Aneurinibacillus sp. Ricciae_BoGa-3]